MALNWDITETKAHQEIPDDKWEKECWGTILQGMVFGLMGAAST